MENTQSHTKKKKKNRKKKAHINNNNNPNNNSNTPQNMQPSNNPSPKPAPPTQQMAGLKLNPNSKPFAPKSSAPKIEPSAKPAPSAKPSAKPAAPNLDPGNPLMGFSAPSTASPQERLDFLAQLLQRFGGQALGDENYEDYDDEYYDDDEYDPDSDIYPDRVKNDWREFISAVRSNDLEYVKKFLRCGGDVNYPRDPQSALHCAVYFGFKDMIALLINAYGADVNIQDEDGDTPLHTAIGEKKGKEIIGMLLNKGASLHIPNRAGYTPFDYARQTKTQYIQDVVNAVTDLCQKVESGDLEGVIKSLAEKNVDINSFSADGVTPLHEAALNGNEKIASFLIEKGASVKSLSQVGAAAKSTPLHCASSKGHTQVGKILIEKGADLNAKNLQGQAPIHCATAQNKHEMVKLLVESKCDIDALNAGRLQALHYAVMDGMVDTVELLLENGSKVNHPGAMTPPIMFASMFKKGTSLQIVKLLVKYGAVVDTKVITAFSGKKDILEFLETVKVM
eukprot:Phypoly_transcript_07350.p1 GENE.Phypoly_transcript_07350~~Phypoly_transcript_07350.p1  ORF type:complete len:508 (+),score=115.34 Phypoly_transcript_07350:95-1618(+)